MKKNGRILCVDDEPNIVRSLQWLLQREFEVHTASDGQAALALVGANDFDVVISDQRMPVMSGVELLREVRRLSPRTMRILLTGYSDMQAVVRSVNESEVFRFINKPWNISELPKIVAQAVKIARTQPAQAPIEEDGEMAAALADEASILVLDDNPGMAEAVTEAVGNGAKVAYTGNLAEAVGILNNEPISVIVSETRVGSIDATRLVRLMKSRHPEIVTIMLSDESDFETVTTLINQGQIYRFVPKPVRPGYLKLIVASALRKHVSLKQEPGLAGRHEVEATPAAVAASLVSDVQSVASQVAARNPGLAAGFLGSIGAGLRRLFGATAH